MRGRELRDGIADPPHGDMEMDVDDASVSFERDVAANLGVRLTALSSHHRDNDRQANLLRPYDSYSKRTVLNLEIDGHDVIAEVDADGVVVSMGIAKVKVPAQAFGHNKAGLLLDMTKAQFEQVVAQAK